MNVRDNSLRWLVEKWLGPASAVRVTRFSRTRADQTRYVGVKVSRLNDALAVFFFRHDDGTWCVFPADVTRPAMGGNVREPLATH